MCYQQHIDRGSMQMIEHQMIYSPERKKNNGYITNVMSHFFYAIQLSIVIIFSLDWPLFLLHHIRNGSSFTSPHVFPISAGFYLTFFSQSEAGWAPQPPLSIDRLQEALDSGNCPFLCRAQQYFNQRYGVRDEI
jgi:hypothetical protein